MTRRSFFLLVIGGVIATILGAVFRNKLKVISRINPDGSRTRVRMFQLHKGDRFEMDAFKDEAEWWLATSDPYIDILGNIKVLGSSVWGINAVGYSGDPTKPIPPEEQV